MLCGRADPSSSRCRTSRCTSPRSGRHIVAHGVSHGKNAAVIESPPGATHGRCTVCRAQGASNHDVLVTHGLRRGLRCVARSAGWASRMSSRVRPTPGRQIRGMTTPNSRLAAMPRCAFSQRGGAEMTEPHRERRVGGEIPFRWESSKRVGSPTLIRRNRRIRAGSPAPLVSVPCCGDCFTLVPRSSLCARGS